MIHSKRCTIIKFSHDHVNLLRKLTTDQEVRRYLGGVPNQTHIEKRINSNLSKSKDDFWIVQEDETGECIG